MDLTKCIVLRKHAPFAHDTNIHYFTTKVLMHRLCAVHLQSAASGMTYFVVCFEVGGGGPFLIYLLMQWVYVQITASWDVAPCGLVGRLQGNLLLHPFHSSVLKMKTEHWHSSGMWYRVLSHPRRFIHCCDSFEFHMVLVQFLFDFKPGIRYHHLPA